MPEHPGQREPRLGANLEFLETNFLQSENELALAISRQSDMDCETLLAHVYGNDDGCGNCRNYFFFG